ncbi:MAG: amino acid adenylation domain-containing protein [Tistlia sp.]|uniref:non-ribosomal peptide synthetase/type I polyketide synthase n=1 Tax=Tistlia sp. TaxID=3057121 RepID=UPI0034A27236
MSERLRELAIVGMGCRLPGAGSPEAFWELLESGREAIADIPSVRRGLAAPFDPLPGAPGKTYSRRAGLLDGVEQFDAGFFGIAPREADAMDPQQRLLLEVAWEALESAGLTRERLAGSATGVFVGISTFDYSRIQPPGPDAVDAYAGTGNALSIAANRLSYLLDLRGPSVAVDTACSSSLVALHLARQSLLSGECERAVVAGVNLLLAPELMVAFSAARMLSADGRCKAFDARADGYVRGEGCGVLVLERLEDARAAGDPVRALLCGSAVNQDGRSNGLTAPNGPAQVAVIRAALDSAGATPAALGYVEAHGTGTRLGDPIEALALAEALEGRVGASLPIGSVKSNIGHLEAAAGVAGVIKTVLALERGRLPASLNYSAPNPDIPFAEIGLRVLAEAEDWPEDRSLAGVSGFGFGGTNAHVLLAPPPSRPAERPALAPAERLLVLSAAEPAALVALARRFAERLEGLGDSPRAFADLCWTAAVRRTHHDHRLALVAPDAAAAAGLLRGFAEGAAPAGLLAGERPPRPKRGGPAATRPLPELAAAFVAGRRIEWQALYPEDSRIADLPSYPWQHRRHWFAEAAAAREATDFAGLAYAPAWVAIDPIEAPDLPGRLAATAARLRDPAREAETGALEAELERLCAGFARRALEAVMEAEVVPAHRRLFARLTEMASDPEAAGEPGALAEELQARFATHRGGIALVAECGRALAEVLRGARDPLEILFPDGSGDRLAALYCDSAVLQLANGLAGEVAAALAAAAAEERPLRVLEVGAGTGGTTEHLLARLPAQRTRYLFTDVAPPLLAQAAARYAERPWLETAVLDIECDPAGQGLTLGAYDLVVAANVLHATRDLGETLSHVGRLLAPGGRLLLLEQTAPRRWLDLVFGLTEGWWRFADAERRPDYPLLRPGAWQELLAEAGFTVEAAEACGEAAAQSVMVARRPVAIRPAGRWLLVADRAGEGAALAAALDAPTIAAGDDPEAAEAEVAAELAAGRFDGLVCLAPLDGGEPGLRRTLAALRGLAASGAEVPAWLVTRGSQLLEQDSAADPWQAAAWGLARSFAAEHPGCAGGLIDLDAATRVEAALPHLSGGAERQVALRAARSLALRLRPLVAPEGGADAPALKVSAEASYLVIGGGGALGGAVAERLVALGARHLLLAGRRPPPAEALERLAALGAQVEALQIDLCDAEGLEAAIAGLADSRAKEGRPLKGVVQAAGAFEDAPFATLSWSACAPLLAAKLGGTESLLRATADLPLDFLLFFSSAAATLGLAKAANYAAANAGLEATVAAARRAGRPAVAVAWGPWAELGMAGRAAAHRWAAAGLDGLTREQALAALERLAGGPTACPLVLSADWPALSRVVAYRDAPAWLSEAAAVRRAAERAANPAPGEPPLLRLRLAEAYPAERAGLVEAFVRRQAMAVLGLGEDRSPPADRGLQDLGMDSLSALDLRDRLQRASGLVLPATLAIEHPTIEGLAGGWLGGRVATPRAAAAAGAVAAARAARPQPDPTPAAAREPIAIVGLSCRFPGGETPEAFWELLAEGRDAIGPIPRDRWDVDRFHGAGGPGRSRAAEGAFLEDVRGFDAAFFHLSGREADALDPQQRLLLEVAWEALERSGLSPDSLKGSRTGVFVGLTSHDYADRQIARGEAERIDAYFGSGNTACFAAGRLSYLLGLSGPSLAVDTACSASLVALHQACLSLRCGESERALVGGVHLMLSPGGYLYNDVTGALAPDGRSKTFDAAADGFGRGEGCAVLVLRRLSDALASGEHILGVIRGSAVNQDGAGGGLTVPNGAAQQAVIRDALADAGLEPDAIDYLEAHGTGTELGDPIELNALGAVFAGRPDDRPLLVGAVKTSVGHLEAAAGLAGLVKTVLALDRGAVPGQPSLRRPNPHVPWSELALRVPRRCEPWPATGRPRRAGVSAFSLMGTNAHVVLEQAPAVAAPNPGPERSHHPFVLSARSPAALRSLAGAVASSLGEAAPIGDRCFTNNAGRAQHACRLATVVADETELRHRLAAVARGERPAEVALGRATGTAAAPVAFLFTGQGAVGAGMARGLYETSPPFAAEIERCARILKPHLDVPLVALLYGEETERLARTRYAQPALVALEWSLACLSRSWGIEPAAVLGHSLGEYVAAAVAGMIDLEDLLPLVAERGRLMDALPEGDMLAVAADAATALEAIGELAERVSLAALNGPRATVLAGDREAVACVESRLGARGLRSQRLPVSHAFHSPMMDPVLEPLAALAGSVSWRAGAVPLARNLDGALLAPGAQPLPADWARHAREPVRFAEALKTLADRGIERFLEIGPRPVLSALGRACLPTARFLPALDPGEPDWRCCLESLTALWLEGQPVDWAAVDRPYGRRRLWQAGYPFERRVHWIEEPAMSEPEGTEGVVAPLPAPRAAADTNAMIALVAEALKSDPADIDPDAPLLELGADSLSLVEVGRLVRLRYGLTLSGRQFFEELTSVRALADYVAQAAPATAEDRSSALPGSTLAAPASTPGPAGAAAGEELAALFARQLDLVQNVVSQQLAALSGRESAVPGSAVPGSAVPGSAVPGSAAARRPAAARRDHGPHRPPRREEAGQGDPRRQAHLEALVSRYTRRTARSKQLAEAGRPRLADSRASAGFRPSIKEMLYPLTGARAEGARLWDIDGNEYIDVSMDFGVNLFGHRAPFLLEAQRAALDRGLAMAPRSADAAAAAELLCELTGMDRVVFCQSGSESVMTAVRLARLAKGRDGIALFRNSYHGHSDGLLAAGAGDGFEAEPVAGGIPAAMVQDVLLLDYGDDASLETLRRHAGRLAAVLVEPVQSRALQLQPGDYLKRLRAVTRELGLLLIFDEMITGFRLHPGGAQAWFGVEADLATYGKAMGGGIEVAAVAGRGDLLDGIDGGLWRYGDASYPAGEVTFFAGTFNGNPLAMASTRAALAEMKRRGPALQADLNALTGRFAAELNRWLAEREVPLELLTCGSLFRFAHRGNLDLLFYHLLEKGVFVWEGRNCFLSAAHGPVEMDQVAQAVRNSVLALREGGYIEASPGRSAVAASRVLPLSAAQQQLWLLAEVEETASLAYTESLALELEGGLEPALLEAALQRLVARHEALRTAIDGDGRTQEIRETLPVALDRASGVPRDAWLAAFLSRPFDLSSPPLLRVGLLEESEGRQVLALAAHHILVDGWSLALLLNDLCACYRAELKGAAPPAAPAGQLSDLVRYQQAALEGARRAELESFWRAALSPLPEPLDLPTDRRPVEGRPRRGGRHRFTLDAGLRRRIEALGRSAGATPFAALLAVVTSFLHQLTGREALLVGCPVLGRGHEADLAEAVGYATHLVPVASRWRAEESFTAHLARTRSALVEALDHQDYPYAELLRLLGLAWSAERPPLLEVTFNLDRPSLGPAIPGVSARLLPSPAQGAKFPLCINALDVEGSLTLDLDYDADLFSPAAVERLAEQLQVWAAALAEQPEAPLRDLTPVGEAERALLLEGWNDTAQAWPADLGLVHEQFEAQAARAPEAPALAFAGRTMSYGRLAAESGALAEKLAALGAGPETSVACLFDRSFEMVVGLLAVLRVGAAYLPVALDEAPERLAGALGDAEPVAALTRAGLRVPEAMRSALAAGRPLLELGPLDLEAPAPETAASALPRAGADQPAYLLFTSGSTGRPKGVVSLHGGLRNRLAWMQQAFPIGHGDTVLQKTPYTFDVSVWEFFWPLTVGARLLVAEPELHRDPRALARTIREERVTVCHFVPSMLAVFVEDPEAAACSSLQRVVCSGEALPRDLVARFHALGLPAELHNLYGPTEAAIDVTHWACLDLPEEPAVPIGRPIANTLVRILDDRGRPVPVGGVGEIHLGGVQLARGYLKRPELTEQAFVPDPFRAGERLYRTGDLGRWRADGAILYLGRRDNQVKLRGQRIELGEIEAALRTHPAVRDAVAGLVGEDAVARRLVAWIVPNAAAPAATELPGGEREGFLLPGGLRIAALNPAETAFMVREHFEERTYFRHGIGLPEDAVVLDIGANAGIFALSVAASLPGARIHAFEPVPAVHALLASNAALAGGRITSHALALAETDGETAFTWYPHVSILSGPSADREEETAVVRAFLQQGGEAAGIEADLLDELVADRLASETVTVPTRRLSGLLDSLGIERVDLLKIDVEKAEWSVLQGIDAGDWPRIRQVVIEVHDIEGRLQAVEALLRERGFEVVAEQERWLAGTAIHCLYARRPGHTLPPVPEPRAESLRAESLGGGSGPARGLLPAGLADGLRDHLARRLPPHMIPDRFVGLAALPLSAHGKIDRKALALPETADPAPAPPRAAETALERELLALWRSLLGTAELGVDDDFFRLGGHSLMAARLVATLRERYAVELPIKAFLERPTVAAAAAAIEASRAHQSAARTPQTAAAPIPAAPAPAAGAGSIRRVDRERRRLDRATLGLETRREEEGTG